jgi:prepilin-type N-terminal cleavage/methylation domain-containing protein
MERLGFARSFSKNFKVGFTLIELLVVVGIIGVLASVVLASLNSARAKGADAAVKANLSEIRTSAELQYDIMEGCYTNIGTLCTITTPAAVLPGPCPASGDANIFGSTGIALQIAGADAAGGFVACSAPEGGEAWAVVGQYKSDVNKAWCVDSTGKSKEVVVGGTGTQGDVTAEVDASGKCVD